MPYFLEKHLITEKQAEQIFGKNLASSDGKTVLSQWEDRYHKTQRFSFDVSNNNNPQALNNVVVSFVVHQMEGGQTKKEYILISLSNKSTFIYSLLSPENKKWALFTDIITQCTEETIIQTLEIHPSLKTIKDDKDNNFLIHHVTANRKRKIVEYLLKDKTQANLPNKDEQTPAHIAGSLSDFHIFKLCVDAGSDLDKKDYQHLTPLSVALKSYDYTKGIKSILNVLAFCHYKYWPVHMLSFIRADQFSNEIRRFLIDYYRLKNLSAEELNILLEKICLQLTENDTIITLISQVATYYLELGANLGTEEKRKAVLASTSSPKDNKRLEELRPLFDASPFLAISEFKIMLTNKTSANHPDVRLIEDFFRAMRGAEKHPTKTEILHHRLTVIDETRNIFEKRSNPIGKLSFFTKHPVWLKLNQIHKMLVLTRFEAIDFNFISSSAELFLVFSNKHGARGDILAGLLDIFHITIPTKKEVRSANDNNSTDQMIIDSSESLDKKTIAISIRIAKTQNWEDVLAKLQEFGFINQQLHSKINGKIKTLNKDEVTLNELEIQLKKLINQKPINWQQVYLLVDPNDPKTPLLINQPLDSRNRSLILIAAANDIQGAAKQLIKSHADILATDINGYNVIHTALHHKSFGFLEEFLQEVCKLQPSDFLKKRDAFSQMWHNKNLSNNLEPYDIAFAQFLVGERKGIDLYIKHYAKFPAEFIQLSCSFTALSSLYDNYHKRVAQNAAEETTNDNATKDTTNDVINNKKIYIFLKEYLPLRARASDKDATTVALIQAELIFLAYQKELNPTSGPSFDEICAKYNNLTPIIIKTYIHGDIYACFLGETYDGEKKQLTYEKALEVLHTKYPEALAEKFYTLPALKLTFSATRNYLTETTALIMGLPAYIQATRFTGFAHLLMTLLYSLCQQVLITDKAIDKTKEAIDFLILCGATIKPEDLPKVPEPFQELFKTPVYKFYAESHWLLLFERLFDQAEGEYIKELYHHLIEGGIKFAGSKPAIKRDIISVATISDIAKCGKSSYVQNMVDHLKINSQLGEANLAYWLPLGSKKFCLNLTVKLESKTANHLALITEAIDDNEIEITKGDLSTARTTDKPMVVFKLELNPAYTNPLPIQVHWFTAINNLALHGILTQKQLNELTSDLAKHFTANAAVTQPKQPATEKKEQTESEMMNETQLEIEPENDNGPEL